MTPFLTIFTPTHRPALLAECMASVKRQTAVDKVQHVIVPDYVGRGIVASLYGGLKRYATSFDGQYVHALADDDLLASPHAVSWLETRARQHEYPEVIVAKVRKGRWDFPQVPVTEAPVLGKVDMASYVIRRDVFLAHVKDYGDRYAGDFDFAAALFAAGYRHVFHEHVFVVGGTTCGKKDGFHMAAERHLVQA